MRNKRKIILTGNVDDYETLGDINYYWKYSALLSNVSSNLVSLITDLFSSTDIFGELYMSRSYNKCLSPYVLKNMDMYGLTYVNVDKPYYKLDSKVTDKLSNIIASVELPMWERLKKVYLDELYDALKPYNIETLTNNEENFGSKTNISKDINKLNNDKRSTSSVISGEDELVNRDSTTKNRINGFNSVTPVNSDDSSTSESSKSTNKGTTENTDNFISNYNEDNYTNSDYSRNKSFNDLTTRIGNIGNITYQELLNKELEVRKYRLQDTIMKGFDKYYVTQKYI